MAEHFKYEEMTDEELIDQLREGDRQVMDYICDKYKNLVRSKAKSMYILGGDSEDLIQEGMIGLFKAVRDYDCGRDASFYTFADLCISRQMYTAVQASKRLKHSPLNSYVSLYERSSEGTDNEEKNLIEALAARTQMSPEELFLDKERVEDLISTGGSVLEVVNVLREAGAEVLGIVSIFTYGMKKGLERLAAAKVKNVSLTNFDVIAQVAAEQKYIKPEDVARLLQFRNDPSDESWIGGTN